MFATAFALIFAVCDLGEIFTKPESWRQTSQEFATQYEADGFCAVDASKSQISCLGKDKCTWFNMPLWESRVYFSSDGVKRVELSLYNRGDASKSVNDSILSEVALAEMLEKVSQKINSKGKPPRVEKKKNRSGGIQSVQKWVSLEPNVELAWGVATDKTADYVRITLTPRSADKPQAITKSVSGRAAAAKVKNNLKKNASGDVWVANVPMVDQGAKGYCAAAVAERVLRYYGHNIDEHQIAQMAGSTAERGTSISSMIETVRTVGSKCRLGFNQIVSMTGSMDGIKKEIDLYNKSAKRLKKSPLRYDDFFQGNCFMLASMQSAMESDVILDMRMKDPRFKKFLKDVSAKIDQGIPVFWGVTLGVFPEPECPQASGGHMRLIIGYNSKTHEILFTDTWGANHEMKRMDEGKAFAITHDAFILRPL